MNKLMQIWTMEFCKKMGIVKTVTIIGAKSDKNIQNI